MRRALLFAVILNGCGYFRFEPVGAPADSAAGDASGADGSTDASPPDAGACSLVSPIDYCVSLPRMSGPPVLDGVIDCGLVPHAFAPNGWYSFGNAPVPQEVSASFAAAWRPDGIYVFVEVTDPTRFPADRTSDLLYCGDGAEVYLDDDGVFASAPGYDTIGTRQFLARAPMTSTGVEQFGNVYRDMGVVEPWRTSGFGTWPRASGYVLEAFVTAADLGRGSWTLEAGADVGLDIGVNVSTADGSAGDCVRRLGQFFLRAAVSAADPCFGRPYCDTTAFCTPALLP